MKQNGRRTPKQRKAPGFVARAERAFRRAAQNVRGQNRAMKLPVIVWQDGKVVEKACLIFYRTTRWPGWPILAGTGSFSPSFSFA